MLWINWISIPITFREQRQQARAAGIRLFFVCLFQIVCIPSLLLRNKQGPC
jgi:hypothetical protein